MWIFGYGSLTFDNWEMNYGCIGRSRADLLGYRRTFNKKSIKNWGSKSTPGVTLNLEPAADAICHGIAFEFAEVDSNRPMLEVLQNREACKPTEVRLHLNDGRIVSSLTYIYSGRNLLDPAIAPLSKAEMIRRQLEPFGCQP